MKFGPSVGEPGYLPYCGGCPTMRRMSRGADAFECIFCGLKTRIINGEDMFERTAPATISATQMRDRLLNGLKRR